MAQTAQALLDTISHQYSHIKAVHITRQKTVLVDYYRKDVNDHTLLRIASATKSFSSALIGTALKHGFIKHVDQTIEDLFPWDSLTDIPSEMRSITLHHLLTMTSGIQWPAPQADFIPQYEDIRILNELTLDAPPGKTSRYKPDVHIIELVIEAVSDLGFNQFVERYLFKPLGIKNYAWHLTFSGSTGLHLNVKDFWKLGQLYLQKGKWRGRELIPEWYIHTSTKPIVFGGFPENERYGYYWWIPELDGQQAYYASGFGGQYLFVFPREQMVIAILSEMDGPHIENKHLIYEYLDSFG